MSYFVEYNPDEKFRYPCVVNRNKKLGSRVVLIATVLVIASFVFIKMRAYELLIPGDPEVTIPAFSGMIADFESGVPVKDAVINFCRHIITGVS